LTTPAVIETTEAPCVSDEDCPDNSWICLQGKCLCQLGNYYSVHLHACVSDCSTSDLLAGYVHYGGYHLEALLALTWFPIFSQTFPQDQCEAHCLVTSGCFAVNFDIVTQECEGIPKDALLLSLSSFQSDASAVFKQRACV
ncbi:hypothetical protein BaRGS_00011350, partial [Batillaria attramentaria]